MTNRIKPSELNHEARRLIVAGQMPSLQELVAAIAEVREKYPLITAARKERNGTKSK